MIVALKPESVYFSVKGQVVIPRRLRKEFEIKEGTKTAVRRIAFVGNKAFNDWRLKEVMNTIPTYAAHDATIIFGTVYEDGMEDQLRVTVVATGLGGHIAKPARKPDISIVQMQRTGTDCRSC